MSRKRTAQILGVVGVLGAAAGLLATTAFSGSGSTPNPTGIARAAETAPAVTVARFGRETSGAAHVVLVQRLSDRGLVCLWDSAIDGAERGGGCNNAADVLAGKQLMINTASSTGPNGSGYTVVRISGLASPSIAGVKVRMSDGTMRLVSLDSDVPASVSGGPTKAFAYNESAADLSSGVVPTAVLAFNKSKEQVEADAVGLSTK